MSSFLPPFFSFFLPSVLSSLTSFLFFNFFFFFFYFSFCFRHSSFHFISSVPLPLFSFLPFPFLFSFLLHYCILLSIIPYLFFFSHPLLSLLSFSFSFFHYHYFLEFFFSYLSFSLFSFLLFLFSLLLTPCDIVTLRNLEYNHTISLLSLFFRREKNVFALLNSTVSTYNYSIQLKSLVKYNIL
jgi:hypothetical protein